MCWVWPIRCDRRSREGFPLPLALQGVWQPLLRLAEGGEAWPLHGITEPLHQHGLPPIRDFLWWEANKRRVLSGTPWTSGAGSFFVMRGWSRVLQDV